VELMNFDIRSVADVRWNANVKFVPLAAAAAIVLALMTTPATAGETACWFENGAVVVPAAFGDITGEFILDASAPASLLHVTTAQTFGIESPTTRAPLRLAGTRTAGFAMRIADLDARSRPFVAGIVGVIGADALAPFVTEIDASPCRVRLSRRAGVGSPGAVRAPLRSVGGVLAVKAAISDGVSGRSGWFAVDTGGGSTQIADAKLSRVPAEGTDPPVRLRALSLGGELVEQAPAALMTDPPSGLAGSIGMAVWSRYRLRLDPRRGWLELGPIVEGSSLPRAVEGVGQH
jgi:hypothetical protein